MKLPAARLGFIVFLLLFVFSGCPASNNSSYPYRSYDSYGNPYYGSSVSDYDYERRQLRNERRNAEAERKRAEEERRRLEAERLRLEEERARAASAYRPPAPTMRQVRCPPGFHPTSRSCSSEDRRHGCKDMRVVGGVCININKW